MARYLVYFVIDGVQRTVRVEVSKVAMNQSIEGWIEYHVNHGVWIDGTFYPSRRIDSAQLIGGEVEK